MFRVTDYFRLCHQQAMCTTLFCDDYCQNPRGFRLQNYDDYVYETSFFLIIFISSFHR